MESTLALLGFVKWLHGKRIVKQNGEKNTKCGKIG